MMGVAAVCTALSAYLLGDVVNQAYVHKNFQALVWVGIATFGLFALKGAATYGQQVIMMRIGNRIVADNQRRMFDKLLHREHRLLLRPPFLRIHRAADHRRGRGEPRAVSC